MSRKWLFCGVVLASVACASAGSPGSSGSSRGGSDPLGSYDPDRSDVAGGAPQFSGVYHEMGLAAPGPPISYVARTGAFATQTPDTSLLLVGLSIPNHGLTFRHSAGGNTASYVVELMLRTDSMSVGQARDSEIVRVPTAREISRSDESIIYHRVFRVPPGAYMLVSRVVDVTGARQAEQRLEVRVPRFVLPAVSTPIPVYESGPRPGLNAAPDVLPAPRGTYVFGVDDSAHVYLESYGGAAPVLLELMDQQGMVIWRGSTTPARVGNGFRSGVVGVPLSGADMGILTLRAVRAGAADTTHASLFLGFSPDLPVVSFEQMVSYLRFFAAPDQLRQLRSATPARRGAVWAAFLRATDPDPTTPRNEAMDAYFMRIRDANEAFRGEGRGGWLSDRGMVYVGLGPPASSFEQYGYLYSPGDIMNRTSGRTRLLVWDYPDLQTRLVFYSPMESGGWRLTHQSALVFPSLLYRNRSH